MWIVDILGRCCAACRKPIGEDEEAYVEAVKARSSHGEVEMKSRFHRSCASALGKERVRCMLEDRLHRTLVAAYAIHRAPDRAGRAA